MKISILHGENAALTIEEYLLVNTRKLSSQIELAIRRFRQATINGDAFLVVCRMSNQKAILWCGYQKDEEAKTINIPFVFTAQNLSPLIRGKCLKLAIISFIEITQKFNKYSFFALTTPNARKIINKILCPPMVYVGAMKNYFVYDSMVEDAFLFWKPSTL